MLLRTLTIQIQMLNLLQLIRLATLSLTLFSLLSCQDNTDEDMRLFRTSLGIGGPTPTPPTVNYYDYTLLPLYGQSLSLMTNATAWTYPSNTAYMKRFDSGFQTPPDEFSSLENAGRNNETVTIMFNAFFRDRNVNDDSILIGCTPGTGGAQITQLWRGTEYYDNLLAFVTQSKRIADDEGKTMYVPAIAWSQGEAEVQLTRGYAGYEDKLNTLISQLNEDIKAITGQEDDIYLLLSQVASHKARSQYPDVEREQLNACLNNPLILLSIPMYNTDFSVDWIHSSTQGYGLMGASYAKRLIDLRKGSAKNGLVPTSVSVVGTKAIITFETDYLPLVFDTTEVQPADDGNMGFQLYDYFEGGTVYGNTISKAPITITSVEIVGSTVEVNFSSDPTGTGYHLSYGDYGDGWDGVISAPSNTQWNLYDTGRANGCRGNLRDSQGEAYQIDVFNNVGDVIFNKIHNWGAIYEAIL